MSLSATRQRRQNAGNRLGQLVQEQQNILAATKSLDPSQIDNDLDDEEDFVIDEVLEEKEQDVFDDDFESSGESNNEDNDDGEDDGSGKKKGKKRKRKSDKEEEDDDDDEGFNVKSNVHKSIPVVRKSESSADKFKKLSHKEKLDVIRKRRLQRLSYLDDDLQENESIDSDQDSIKLNENDKLDDSSVSKRRSSKRRQTVANRAKLLEKQTKAREKRNKIILEPIKYVEKIEMTQEQKIQEALMMEEINKESLNDVLLKEEERRLARKKLKQKVKTIPFMSIKSCIVYKPLITAIDNSTTNNIELQDNNKIGDTSSKDIKMENSDDNVHTKGIESEENYVSTVESDGLLSNHKSVQETEKINDQISFNHDKEESIQEKNDEIETRKAYSSCVSYLDPNFDISLPIGEFTNRVYFDENTDKNNDTKDEYLMLKNYYKTKEFNSLKDFTKCVITGKKAKYVEPRTKIPYSDVNSYKILKELIDGEYGFSPILVDYIHKFNTDEKKLPKSIPEHWIKSTFADYSYSRPISNLDKSKELQNSITTTENELPAVKIPVNDIKPQQSKDIKPKPLKPKTPKVPKQHKVKNDTANKIKTDAKPQLSRNLYLLQNFKLSEESLIQLQNRYPQQHHTHQPSKK